MDIPFQFQVIIVAVLLLVFLVFYRLKQNTKSPSKERKKAEPLTPIELEEEASPQETSSRKKKILPKKKSKLPTEKFKGSPKRVSKVPKVASKVTAKAQEQISAAEVSKHQPSEAERKARYLAQQKALREEWEKAELIAKQKRDRLEKERLVAKQKEDELRLAKEIVFKEQQKNAAAERRKRLELEQEKRRKEEEEKRRKDVEELEKFRARTKAQKEREEQLKLAKKSVALPVDKTNLTSEKLSNEEATRGVDRTLEHQENTEDSDEKVAKDEASNEEKERLEKADREDKEVRSHEPVAKDDSRVNEKGDEVTHSVIIEDDEHPPPSVPVNESDLKFEAPVSQGNTVVLVEDDPAVIDKPAVSFDNESSHIVMETDDKPITHHDPSGDVSTPEVSIHEEAHISPIIEEEKIVLPPK
eukprot:TRINITY_DN1949_c0_g1_i1.p1 TRINITY_DN1949_c0_g1~~TRINITY_DN1949_c0_g1_i1.p1  ORF type:complete len:416 (-),score=125.15 TRINITY_DN1949_c0_g1_i1:156-1403(-)